MLQDIAPHIFDNGYEKKRPAAAGDKILCFRKNEIWLKNAKDEAGYDFMAYEELFPGADRGKPPLYYLFSIDDTGYYLASEEMMEKALEAAKKKEMEEEERAMKDSEERFFCTESGFQPVQVFRTMSEGDSMPLAIMTGLHIFNWLKKNRYCGSCGHETELHERERAIFCPRCKNLIFPQIAPAVAVAVIDKDKILMAKSAGGSFHRFALIAGYAEVGESIEETVHREVWEEVGLRVKNLEYFKSQPWGLTGIEMLGFFAELDGSGQVTLQESELSEARWFTAEEIDRNMALHSLSFTMIDEFCKRQLGK